jgi:hypothetical protein
MLTMPSGCLVSEKPRLPQDFFVRPPVHISQPCEASLGALVLFTAVGGLLS